MPTSSGYDPSQPIGVPYGRSGPAVLPTAPTSPINTGPQSPYGSGSPVSGPQFTSAQQSALQNALSAAGIWDTIKGLGGDVWAAVSKILPKNADGSIDWGGALKDVGSWVKNNKDTILQGLAAYNNYQRSQKSDEYAQQALAGAKEAYAAKEPLRVAGQAGTTLDSPRWRILPGDQRRLPTAALGWQGGGLIAVEQDDRDATKTTEPFFEVVAELPTVSDVALLHLRGGQAKFSMEPRPLAVQWWRSLRQLLQKRYQF